MYKASKKTSDIAAIVKGVILIAVAAIAAVIIFTGKVNVTFYDVGLSVSATLTSDSAIGYYDIEEVKLVDDYDQGARTFGIGSPSLNAGNFSSSTYGAYKLYAYASNSSAIVMKTKDGYVVFNGKDKEQTVALYSELLKMIDAYNASQQ